jgi:hypothetical protein
MRHLEIAVAGLRLGPEVPVLHSETYRVPVPCYSRSSCQVLTVGSVNVHCTQPLYRACTAENYKCFVFKILHAYYYAGKFARLPLFVSANYLLIQ